MKGVSVHGWGHRGTTTWSWRALPTQTFAWFHGEGIKSSSHLYESKDTYRAIVYPYSVQVGISYRSWQSLIFAMRDSAGKCSRINSCKSLCFSTLQPLNETSALSTIEGYKHNPSVQLKIIFFSLKSLVKKLQLTAQESAWLSYLSSGATTAPAEAHSIWLWKEVSSCLSPNTFTLTVIQKSQHSDWKSSPLGLIRALRWKNPSLLKYIIFCVTAKCQFICKICSLAWPASKH